MSRSTLIVAIVALVVGAGALILQFALPSQGGGVDDAAFQALRNDVEVLQSASGSPLRIAVLDAEDAFTVFLSAMSDLRTKVEEKVVELTELEQQNAASAISREEYQTRRNQVMVEMLQARLNVVMGTIDRMIASAKFADVKAELMTIREQAQPLVNAMNDLVSEIHIGVLDPQQFQTRYTQVETTFSQLDQLLSNAASQKIIEATDKVAVNNGFDLVISKKNVVVYGDARKLTDITDLVKAELASYI